MNATIWVLMLIYGAHSAPMGVPNGAFATERACKEEGAAILAIPGYPKQITTSCVEVALHH